MQTMMTLNEVTAFVRDFYDKHPRQPTMPTRGWPDGDDQKPKPKRCNPATTTKHPRVDLKANYPRVPHCIKIEFDGGTPCNIPRLGYGDGYGSFQISENGIALDIQRVKFGIPMSANVAEISTLIRALQRVKNCYNPEKTFVEIHGDSMIALNRCKVPLKPKKQDGSAFANAVNELQALCREFSGVETHWRGRAASVKLFGH